MKQGGRQLNPERRDRILTAAETLFLRNGLRGTSMEAIAREAGVAKPTLYAYFADKDAVLVGIVSRRIGEWQALVTSELAREGAPADRIARTLSAKEKAYFRMIKSSPHAVELVGTGTRVAATETAAFEKWLEGALTEVLNEGGYDEPRRWAQILLACATGICGKAKFAEEIGPATRLVVEHLLR